MGLFGGRTRGKNNSDRQRPTISHTASWSGIWVTFYINSDGVSWNQSNRDFGSLDNLYLEAALSQLEGAYHLSTSFPNAESRIMDWMRETQRILKQVNPDTPDIPEDATPAFTWNPPLPGYE